MSNTPNDTPNGGIRIGDAERNEAVSRLGEHYEAGRLSADEHSERVDQALRATTQNDLDALFTDLPGGARQEPGTGEGWGPPWAQHGPGQPWGGWFGGPQGGERGPQDQPAGGRYGSGAPFGGPPWARGGWRGPRAFGFPIPLVAIVAFLALAGLLCSVLGGHPPVLLIVAAIVAGVVIAKRRRFGSA